jgi:hypothetical protein
MVIKVMSESKLCGLKRDDTAFQRVALWFEPREVLRLVAEELTWVSHFAQSLIFCSSLLQKLTVAQLLKKFLPFMEAEC